jgi:hypothetical protein
MVGAIPRSRLAAFRGPSCARFVAGNDDFTVAKNDVAAGKENSVRLWVAENQNSSYFLFFLLLETSCCGYEPVKHRIGLNFKGLMLKETRGLADDFRASL